MSLSIYTDAIRIAITAQEYVIRAMKNEKAGFSAEAQEQAAQRLAKLRQAKGRMRAAQARVSGEWDHPELEYFGPLSESGAQDVLDILCGTRETDAPRSLSRKVIGFQVVNKDGECWADRASFEVLDAQTAMFDMTAASASAKGCWRMIHIHEGDIECPEFIQAEDAADKEGYDHG